MHGLGNDFVIVDARGTAFPIDETLARGIADRRTGIGCDQLILLEPSSSATVRMRIFNADGGEVEACGNASRCVASLLGGDSTIETAGGLLLAKTDGDQVTVEVAAPRFDWEAIPLAYAVDTAAMPIGWDALERPMAVNVGNPHVVFFVDDIDAIDLATLGPRIEHDPVFPDRINVNVAQRLADGTIRLNVWERGAGLTRACGTGACATAVAAIRRGIAASPVTISLPGGALMLEWAPGGPISMRGPATLVFTGEADTDSFA